MKLEGLSFCESVYASGITRWHLRELDGEGKKLGGGITTPSLCGLVKVRMGWDLNVPVTEDRVVNIEATCQTCRNAAEAR